MYSPKIYESQIPSLYHASKKLGVPMTQLANAFVYHGLASGYFGPVATEYLPAPNEVLPEGIAPKMQIFNPEYDTLRDYMRELPPIGTANVHFQTLEEHKERKKGALEYLLKHTKIPFSEEEKNEPIPF